MTYESKVQRYPSTMSKDQEQAVSEGGAALQAGRDIVITSSGLTYAEVKEVALDVFRENFSKFVGVAKETATTRAEEITDAFLEKLHAEYPEALQQARNPDFQYALLTVQKEHARIGDNNLGDLLVDLLVDRAKQKQRDILQIVLDESLNTAPKLTENQLAVLSIVFLLRYTQHHGVGNHNGLGSYFDTFVKPFHDKLVKTAACYQHLEFAGCGAVGLGAAILEKILGTTYQGQFLKGFEIAEITARGITLGKDTQFFIPCLNDFTRVQIRSNNHELLDKCLEQEHVADEDKKKIGALFDVNKMSDEEIKQKCINIRPYMEHVFDMWNSSQMKNFTLTSVGIAIGHANIKRLTGEFADLSIWIN